MVTRLKRPGQEAYRPSTFSAKDMNMWSHNSIQDVFMAALLNTGTSLYFKERPLVTSKNLMNTGQSAHKLLVVHLHIYSYHTNTPKSDFAPANSVIIRPQANYIDQSTTATIEASAYFCRWGVLRGQRNGSLRPLIWGFYTGTATISSKYFLSYPHEVQSTPSQAHYFSENLVASVIESGTSGPVVRHSDH
jgi:hypothetical protein